MKNIRIIQKDIDVSGILKQLEQYPEDWGNTLRMKGTDRQDPHTKLVTSGVLQLVMGGVTQPGEFIGDTEICVPTDATKRHTEIQKWLSTLNLKVGRCAFLKTDLVYCQDIIKPIAKEQLKSNYPLHSVVGGCGINEIVFIEDNIDSIMDYLEVKFNNEEK
jgi:hypothetical protein